MSTINIWLAVRDDAQAIISTRLNWDEEVQGTYSGPVTDRQAKLFGYMHDRENTQRLFRVDSDTRDWTIWNVYFDFPKDVLLKVKAELDQLMIDYPNHIKIVGAWKWDGIQIADYPPHTRLIEFMPDDITYDQNGTELTRTRPLVPRDVNLGMGQTERQF